MKVSTNILRRINGEPVNQIDNDTLNRLQANNELVSGQIYFVKNVGIFIGTSSSTYESCNRPIIDNISDNILLSGLTSVTAVTGYVSSSINDLNINFKADRDVSTNSGQIAKIDEQGDAVGTGYVIGDIISSGFGASGELAVESAVTGYIDSVINSTISDLNINSKADRDILENSGQVAKIDEQGDAVGAGYIIGDIGLGGFGASGELAVESAVTGYVSSSINDLNINSKADRDTLENSGQVAKIDEQGDAVGTGYTIGDVDLVGFGASGELAVESAVTGYVSNEIKKVNQAATDAISGISFNNETAQISYIKVGANSSISISDTISGLVRDFIYSNGKIILTGTNNFSREINIPKEQFLADVKSYNIPTDGVTTDISGYFTGIVTDTNDVIPSTTFDGLSGIHGIVFRFATQDGITSGFNYDYAFISIEDIVKDYNAEQFKLESGKLELKSIPNELISGYVSGYVESQNFATKTYVDTQDEITSGLITGWVDENYIKNVSNHENEVPLFNANGNISSSNKIIGNNTLSGFENTLATEKAVSGFVDDKISVLSGKIDKVIGYENEVTKFDVNGNVISTNKTIGLSAAFNENYELNEEFGGSDKIALESLILDCLTFK